MKFIEFLEVWMRHEAVSTEDVLVAFFRWCEKRSLHTKRGWSLHWLAWLT